ncbi:MAG: acyl carrier protein [Paraglaciecola sp.]|jgi:acyl carrier protein
MNTSKNKIISSLRESLNKVAKKNFDDIGIDESLDLDSINRISLIVELEWVYDLEIDSGELEPEVFDSLNSLATFIEKLVEDNV